MILGTKSLVVLCTILMYDPTRLLIVSTCLSKTGSIEPISSFLIFKIQSIIIIDIRMVNSNLITLDEESV